VADTVRFLNALVEFRSRQGSLAAAEDCHARALSLLLPPHAPFWARAITTLTHAAWRDTPLGRDARCVVAPAVALELSSRVLRTTHTDMGLAYSRAGGRAADAAAAFERALAALAREPPGPERDVTAAGLHENIGNQHLQSGQLAACGTCYDAALRLIDGAVGGNAVRRAGLRVHLNTNRAALASALRAPGQCDTHDDLADLEEAWALCLQHREGGLSGQWEDAEGTPAGTCRTALSRASTPAQRRTWLLRAFELTGVQAAARAAAALGCRACGTPPAGSDKLKRCGACSRVAFCGAACQKADWPRHKRACKAATPAAALADAVCVACLEPLLPADEPAAASDHPLSDGIFLLRCLHVAHAACLGGPAGVCPACPQR
jgi:hypothetical protein